MANERTAMLARLRALQKRYDTAVSRVDALEDERAALYVEARNMTPPITFRTIADIFGITEAAVMQKIRRSERNGHPAPAKARG